MMEYTNSTTARVPEPLRSPGGHASLVQKDKKLFDMEGHQVGNRLGPVWSFMEVPDSFYEGKYNNRIHFTPKNDGFWATFPMRLVAQGYPIAVSQAVQKGGTVVEIGCAAGVVWFGKRYTMIGIDLSKKALELASGLYNLVLQADGTKMPLADASVDAVISSCLFEHLTKQQKQALLTECVRVLKPGGKVVFLYDLWTDNPVIAHYRRAEPERYQRMFLDGDGHLGYADVDENRAYFRRVGLQIDREIFHESTPIMTNSVWTKFSEWPGLLGRIGKIGKLMTSGRFLLPWLALRWAVDSSVGRLMPDRFARGMITVATKP